MMKTFAIETSCDDTSLGIVEYQDGFFSCSILKAYSQINDHQEYGGVVPEIAYRLHEEKILELVREIGYDTIAQCDCITVTREPGLPGSLIVGNTVASMLGEFLQKPVYRVNHIHGHIFSLLLDRNMNECPFPWVVLTASGGHNELYCVYSESGTNPKFQIRKIGYSLDDAAGESFDKVARMLGGSYPGGPWIDNMAKSGHSHEKRKFKRILLDGKGTNTPQELIDHNTHNFSFSGMKSQAYQFLQKNPIETVNEQDIHNICREFQECVADILCIKLLQAVRQYGAKTIGLVGGVSANDRLFEKINEEIQAGDFECRACIRPAKKAYSMDNGAMIGVVGILTHLDLI